MQLDSSTQCYISILERSGGVERSTIEKRHSVEKHTIALYTILFFYNSQLSSLSLPLQKLATTTTKRAVVGPNQVGPPNAILVISGRIRVPIYLLNTPYYSIDRFWVETVPSSLICYI